MTMTIDTTDHGSNIGHTLAAELDEEAREAAAIALLPDDILGAIGEMLNDSPYGGNSLFGMGVAEELAERAGEEMGS